MASKIIYTLIFSFLCIEVAFLQNTELSEFPFTFDGITLSNPYSGGFDAPQLGKVDLDLDGQEDLIVYDRRGDVVRTFLFTNSPNDVTDFSYEYAPEYIANLPAILNWFKVEDYDQDGIKDIFTSPRDFASSAIQVFKGKIENEKLSYDLVEFPDRDLDILYFPFNESFVNVFVSPIDIPSIKDIDGDGDLDVLAFEPGGSFVYYYENKAVERGLELTELEFELEDMCFGKFKESGINEEIVLSDSNVDCALNLNGFEEISDRHAGSTVEAFDGDGDGDFDLLLGDLTSNRLVYLENGGDPDNAFMVDTIFGYPNNSEPAFLPIFIAAFVIDIDNDGKKDLVAAPNSGNSTENIENIWFYKNMGEDNNPDFQLLQKDFLNENNIDLGTEANPCFFDYNQDGLMDLLVGTSGKYNPVTANGVSLVLFENQGSATNPEFVLVDSDYLDFSINRATSSNPSPAAGDVDGDGDEDLIVGDNQGNLYYYENTSGPSIPYDFAQPVFPFMDIRPGQNIKVEIIDYNKDGMGDLIIGERNPNAWDERVGNINYYENLGTLGNPFFEDDITIEPNTPTLGDINTRIAGSATGSSAPKVFETEDGFSFVIGSESGNIYLYESGVYDLEGTFPEITDNLSNIYEGRFSTVDFSDIDNDGFFEVAIGNTRGGIAIYNTILQTNGTLSNVNTTSATKVKIYPNPANEFLYVEAGSAFEQFKIYDTNGRLIKSSKYNVGEKISIYDLPKGVFILHLLDENRSHASMFVRN